MDCIDLFVPGRLCLFGEHTDWAGKYMSQNPEILEGQAIVTGINLGIYAKCSKSEKFKITSIGASGECLSLECDMEVETLKQYAVSNNFFSYCCGVAAYLKENYNVGGIEINIDRITLPMKKGLSSSAAICVLVTRAFNILYRLRLSTNGEMFAAYKGERLTKSRCGRLDQACAYGEQPVLMHFTDDEIATEKIRVGKTLYFVFADLCAQKNTKKILSYLNRAYPYAQDKIAENVQKALGEENHKIIEQAKKAIENGDAELLGQLMTQAQCVFDANVAPACWDELESPVLHSILYDSNIEQYIWGGKGVGSQGDGSVQLLAKNKEAQCELLRYLSEVRGLEAFGFELKAGGKIRKAIIPIAGLGTRLYPETHFVKKAFLPLVDQSGIVKPVLLHIIEELLTINIEEIILIVGDGETDAYKQFFSFTAQDSVMDKLPVDLRESYKRLKEIGQKIKYVEQKEKRGFGHAVYQARKMLNGEPAILMLGDFVYQSNLNISCVQQTVNAFNKTGGNSCVVSIKEVPLNDVRLYGILSGKFTKEYEYLMNVDEMVEKPSAEFAEEHLAYIDKCGVKHFYATFGQYVVTDELFGLLERQIQERSEADKTEIDLTNAFQQLASEGKLVAVDVAGKSFDVGTPKTYYESFIEFGKTNA